MRPYCCVTDDGFRLLLPSGSRENTNASGADVASASEQRTSHRARCSVRAVTVLGSTVTCRRWWVLVSFSAITVPSWAIARRTVMTARFRSMWRHRSAHSSPRRAPVTIVSQTKNPQCTSIRYASAISRAASSGEGG